MQVAEIRAKRYGIIAIGQNKSGQEGEGPLSGFYIHFQTGFDQPVMPLAQVPPQQPVQSSF